MISKKEIMTNKIMKEIEKWYDKLIFGSSITASSNIIDDWKILNRRQLEGLKRRINKIIWENDK